MIWLFVACTPSIENLICIFLDSQIMLFLINEIVVFIFGLFFNITLLFLIHLRTPDLMRPYSVVLQVHAISDILFDFMTFITSVVSSLI